MLQQGACCFLFGARVGTILLLLLMMLVSAGLAISMPLASSGGPRVWSFVALPCRMVMIGLSGYFVHGAIKKREALVTWIPLYLPICFLAEATFEMVRLYFVDKQIDMQCSKNPGLDICLSFVKMLLLSQFLLFVSFVLGLYLFIISRSYAKELAAQNKIHKFQRVKTENPGASSGGMYR